MKLAAWFRSALMAHMAAGLFAVCTLPAAAQGLGESFDGLQVSGDQPISIEADQLDVDDTQAIATFTGNVAVSQGDTLLKTSKLVVHYVNQPEGGGEGEGESASVPGASGNIDRLEATGQVYIRSQDQIATADAASFDMDTQVVVLTGDVVLSQGENVATGCRMTIQMETGQARLEACEGANDGRVRMMLTPQDGETG